MKYAKLVLTIISSMCLMVQMSYCAQGQQMAIWSISQGCSNSGKQVFNVQRVSAGLLFDVNEEGTDSVMLSPADVCTLCSGMPNDQANPVLDQVFTLTCAKPDATGRMSQNKTEYIFTEDDFKNLQARSASLTKLFSGLGSNPKAAPKDYFQKFKLRTDETLVDVKRLPEVIIVTPADKSNDVVELIIQHLKKDYHCTQALSEDNKKKLEAIDNKNLPITLVLLLSTDKEFGENSIMCHVTRIITENDSTVEKQPKESSFKESPRGLLANLTLKGHFVLGLGVCALLC